LKPGRPKKPDSITGLAERTGSDRRSIKRWLAEDGIDASDPRAIDVITKHQKQSNDNIDPETGLTWFQAKVREDAIKVRRENEIAERLESETYMETEQVEKLVLMFLGKLELVHVKLESEFSLDPKIVKRLVELIDEARSEMAKGVLKS
jgi:hypothetical protein